MVAGDHHVRGRSVEEKYCQRRGPDQMLFGGPPFSDERHDPSARGFLEPEASCIGAQLHKVTSARVMHWRRWFHIPPDPHVSSEAVSE